MLGRPLRVVQTLEVLVAPKVMPRKVSISGINQPQPTLVVTSPFLYSYNPMSDMCKPYTAKLGICSEYTNSVEKLLSSGDGFRLFLQLRGAGTRRDLSKRAGSIDREVSDKLL